MDEGKIEFRDGVRAFLKFLNNKNVPLVIISASGAGEAIPMFFERKNLNYPNIYFIVNRFKWDKEGKAIGHKEPLIHSMNKDEQILEEEPEIYKNIKDRRDVVLLGDSLGDLDMITGFDYEQLLTISFLCYNITNKRRKSFKDSFNVVLEGESGFGFVNDLFGI